MATVCKTEFQLKYFGFNDASPDLFQHLQWSKNRWVFFAYRFFMAAYTITWMIWNYIKGPQEHFWRYLTYWTEGVMIVYFTVAFLVSIWALVNRNHPERTLNEGKLPWFLQLNWLMSSVSHVAGFQISLMFWSIVAPGRSNQDNFNPGTLNLHLVNSILLFIDIWMIAFPVRLLHFIYVTFYGILYTIFVLILHFTNVDSSVYRAINFKTNPGTAAGLLALSDFGFPIILTAVVFGLYHLRLFIAKKTVLKNEETKSKENLATERVNQAYGEKPESQESPV